MGALGPRDKARSVIGDRGKVENMDVLTIDGHTHITSIVPPEYRIPEPEQGYARLLIEMMDEAGVDKAVVAPIAPLESNEMIVENCQRYPDRLIGFASVDPNSATTFDWHVPVKQLTNDIENYKLAGLKLNPRIQNFSLRDPRIIPIFRCAADFDIPILLDGIVEISPIMLEENLPFALDRVLRAVPAAKVIIAHMGGHRILDAYAVAVTHSNVFLDLSAILYLYKGSSVEQDIKFVIRDLAPRRQLVFGSDFPFQAGTGKPLPIKTSIDACLALFKEVGLSQQEIANIMGGTMAQLLHLA